jgi:hypothetical protein
MFNRRIFIRTSLFGGIGLLTSGLLSCKKDDTENEPVSPSKPEIDPKPGMDLYGLITDTEGNPLTGVVVSDGFTCVVTDEKGIYQMKRNEQASIVFYSTPSVYEINITGSSSNAAMFYSALSAATKRYDFTLKKLPQIETDFTLLCIGDPQVTSASDVERFRNETMPDLKAFVNASAKPCYGLVMGDVTGDHPELFAQMKNLMGSGKMTFFTTIGNHDKTGGNDSTPRNAQAFCAVYGPLDYSFNRGNVHFVCLDNVVYTDKDNYAGGFEDHQIEWLKQDLSYVPKDKMLVVYYHIPIRNTAVKNRTAFLNALRDFSKVHFMCGHTHYHENFFITSPVNIHEHIHAAACGAWWKSTVNCDGVPNGYAVYEISGTAITNWYYKPTNYSKDFQIRLHWGDTQFGGQYGYFNYKQGGNIVANIWNADPDWKIEAYEDGVNAGNLTKMSTVIDAWAAGYHVGVLNRNPSNYGATGSGSNKHAYLHTLKNKNARTIEIRATDRFGTVYTQTEIISDLKTAAAYS